MSDLMDAGELACTVNVESLNVVNGTVSRRRVYKNVSIVCCRDEFRDIILRILAKNSPLGKTYRLRDITIHKRFLQEGKATIKLVTQNIQLLLSNCPPSKLALFLKCLSLKLAQQKESGFASERTRIRSDLPRLFENISPLSEKDLNVSKKRPFGDVNDNGLTPKRCKRGENRVAPRKKLNVLSPLQTNLTAEQLEIIKAVRSARNVFFTGSAGTGKTFLLRKLLGILPPEGTFVTASTGAAACHIGGTTLHAFAGIGSGSANIEHCIELASRPERLRLWKTCKRLIIDEISMVDADLFDKLEAVARSVRNNDRPFGGIQLILSGDFLQLPPVSKIKEGKTKKFCLQAESWQDCINTTIELTNVFRQRDPLFVSILQNIRVGSCPEKIVSKILETRNHTIERDGILATKLCTHKENVDQINDIHMSQIIGKIHSFTACDSDPGHSHVISKQLPVPEKIELKIGAQVMLVKNLNVNEGLVNGARGVVKGFETGNTANPIIKFTCGIEKAITAEKWVIHMPGGGVFTRRQLPLKLAWAVSIHKSQGMTLDCVEMSLANVFEYGQAYVALSRARSLQSLRILDFDKKCVRAHPEVLRFYGQLRKEQQSMSKIHKVGKTKDDKENVCPR